MQIKNSTIIDEGTHGDKEKLLKKYNSAIKNTRTFNLGLLTSKETKLSNGFKTEFFRKDTKELLLEWYLIHDRQGWELGAVTYKTGGEVDKV